MNFALPYTNSAANIVAAKSPVAAYVCPSDAHRQSAVDRDGFGATDYGCTYYTDIDPDTGQSNGGLTTGGTAGREISDGLSQKIAVSEDVGRLEEVHRVPMVTTYVDGHGELRKSLRWAEPDNAFGVGKGINNNFSPFGGPETCPWSSNNCGMNDEMFGFHPGGVNVVYCDGHVGFLQESLDPRVLRKLFTRSEGDLADVDAR